jgi:hypothetical protein
MALELSLEFLQQNDNKAVQITDSSGTYHAVDNDTGWGAPNEAVTDIVESTDDYTASKYHLLLNVNYTGSDSVTIVYDQLNLYDVNGGPFADASDLTWSINPADLVSGGAAMGDSDSELLDGKYDFTYLLVSNSNHATVAATTDVSILLDGNIRVKLYNQLRQISTIYNSTETFVPIYHPDFKDILETLLKKGLFDSMLAGVTHAATEDVLNLLDTIERLTLND